MSEKPQKKAAGEAVPNDADKAAVNQSQALVTTGDGDVSGSMKAALALSQEMRDQLTLELQEALHQVEEGFGALTNAGDVAAMGIPFHVIDAVTVPDYFDRSKGEILTKHIFKLQLQDGRVLFTMQGDARPRRVFASVFQKARSQGMRVEAGPYLYVKKPIPGQPQAAWIFEQQPGFRAELIG